MKTIQENTIYAKNGLILGIKAPDNVHSTKEEIVLEYFSPKSNLSIAARLDVQTTLHNDLPVVLPSSPYFTYEDSPLGVTINVVGTDEEGTSGVVLALSRLPSKGTLSYIQDGVDKSLDDVYSSFYVGSPIEQYVAAVRNFSTFRTSSTHFLSNHPLAIVGPPDCSAGFLNRVCDPAAPLVDNLRVGRFLYVNIYTSGSFLSDPSKTFFAPCTIVKKMNESTYQVRVLPTFKYTDDGEAIRCLFYPGNNTGSYRLVFPRDCKQGVLPDGDFLVAAQTHDLHDLFPEERIWRPSIFHPSGFYDEIIDGTITQDLLSGIIMLNSEDHSGILGEKYRYSHRFSDGMSDSRRPYTEFVEVEFAEKVYPQFVEVGSPWNAGAIVSIMALDPNGDWVTLFGQPVQRDQHEDFFKTNRFNIFHNRVCQQNFKTNVLRIEMDTSARTGIPDVAIDYIKLLGSPDISQGMLPFGVTNIKYIPGRNKHGVDSFDFKAWDCGGQNTRASAATSFYVDIDPRPDAPIIITEHDKLVVGCGEGIPSVFPMSMAVGEIDEEDVEVRLVNSPLWGSIVQNNATVAHGDKLQVYSAGQTVTLVDFEFHNGDCVEDPSVSAFDFSIGTIDSSGQFANQNVHVVVLWEDKLYPTRSIVLAKCFIGINFACCAICFMWVLFYRDHPIVRASQKEFLLLVLVGIVISTSTIFTVIADDGPDGTAEQQLYADYACQLMPWFYSIGFSTTLGTIYAKLYKVEMLFSSKIFQKSEKKALRTKALFVRKIVGVVILWVGFNICWASVSPLKFKRVTTKNSSEVVGHDSSPFAIESVGYCDSEQALVFLVLLELGHCITLLNLAYHCYRTMHINSAFSEAKYLRISVSCTFQLMVFSLPLLLISANDPVPDTVIFVRSISLWLNDLLILVLLFAPKMYMVKYGVQKGGDGYNNIKESLRRTTQDRKKKNHQKGGDSSDEVVSPSDSSGSGTLGANILKWVPQRLTQTVAPLDRLPSSVHFGAAPIILEEDEEQECNSNA